MINVIVFYASLSFVHVLMFRKVKFINIIDYTKYYLFQKIYFSKPFRKQQSIPKLSKNRDNRKHNLWYCINNFKYICTCISSFFYTETINNWKTIHSFFTAVVPFLIVCCMLTGTVYNLNRWYHALTDIKAYRYRI